MCKNLGQQITRWKTCAVDNPMLEDVQESMFDNETP